MCVSGIVEVCGGERHFLRSVHEALKMSERKGTMALWAESEGASLGGSVSGSGFGSVGTSRAVSPRRRGVQPEHDPIAGAFAPGDEQRPPP